MVTVQSSGTGIAFRTPRPEQLRKVADITGIRERFEVVAGLTENNITPEEYRELAVLEEFLTTHIQTDGLRDVQCMLLWSEWVRDFRKQTHRFPNVILEKEFRKVITNQLGVNIIHDTMRGAVYPGIRFIP